MAANIKIIPIKGLSETYMLNYENGLIYDRKMGGSIVPTFEHNDECCVKLIPEDTQESTIFSVTDLYVESVFSHTGLNPSFRIQSVPTKLSILYVVPRPIMDTEDGNIQIGDYIYRRWNDSKYFVNEFGAVFSEPYGAIVKQGFAPNGYRLLNINKQVFRTQQLVWEAFTGNQIINVNQIRHKNGLKWDNRFENLAQNVDKRLINDVFEYIDPNKKPSDEDETVTSIINDIKNGVSNDEICEKYNIPMIHLMNIICNMKAAEYKEKLDEIVAHYRKRLIEGSISRTEITPEIKEAIKLVAGANVSKSGLIRMLGCSPIPVNEAWNQNGVD